ncbi:MAG: indole-3-glycerol phosphate synthase TrpC [Pelagibacterales bacterium]|nr:indole-3-glycerol phosphate synthase TrpC [Pelagibacterales bacterium]
MKNILEEIYQHKLVEVRNKKKILNLKEICSRLKCSDNKPKDFFGALKAKDDSGQTALICEIKKASPSKGIIRADFNPVEIAQIYDQCGATCLSILTDEKYFAGSDEYIKEVRKVTNLPILRKEFIVDSYQIYEAKMLGADCILLIVAMLDDAKLNELEDCALGLGLSVLIEVHNEEELQRAFKMKSKLIGINNRNLKTLEVDIRNSLKLADHVPSDYVLVGESGIKDIADILLLKEAGINCFLIGEHFMAQKNIATAVKAFLE